MTIANRVFGAACLMTGLAMPALALDAGEAERVVGLMETLSSQMGLEVYHGGGDAFLEADHGGEIAAAGFSEARWLAGFDEVVSGYMASIPQGEFEAAFIEALALLDESALADDQKAMIRAEMDAHIALAQQTRRDGAAYVDAVRALKDRLDVLILVGG